ncbi:MAG: integrase arm-type DNA-binding domain-containing protein, partial [Sphingomicrobium sp.]
MMAKVHLTDTAVERYRRPQTGRREISDSEPGLFLWVSANGIKSWVLIYRLPSSEGKRTVRKKKVVGQHPEMGVTQAREKARQYMSAAAKGVDPEQLLAERQMQAERERTERNAGTFRAVAEEWVATMEAGRLVGGRKRAVTAETAAGRKSLLERRVFPAIGDKPLDEITPFMVNRLLTAMEADEGPVDNTLKVVRGVYRFAASRGLFAGQPPTAGMTSRQARVKETRALSDEELANIWKAATRVGWPYGSLVRGLMLTGQRRREIAFLRWDEVDFERRLLTIPRDRVKNRAGAHEVPMAEPLETVLREAKSKCEETKDESGLVFPSAVSGGQLAGWNKLKKLFDRDIRADLAGLSDQERRALRAGGALRAETRERKAHAEARLTEIDLAPWRIHDLRHTFITRCRDGEENAEGEIVWSAPLDVLQATAVEPEVDANLSSRADQPPPTRAAELR